MLSTSYHSILRVAIPLMVGTFIQSVVLITDASFLSRYSTISFDASGNAGLIYVTLFMALSGLGDAGQIIMARRIGENKKSWVNSILQNSIFLNFCIGLLFFGLVHFIVPPMLYGYSNNIAIASEQIEYLSIRSYGFFVGAFLLAFNAFFMAIGKTWVILISTLVFAISNIILDYLFIFGFGSLPPMGIEGAALASVFAEFISLMVMIVVLFFHNDRKIYQLFSVFALNIKTIQRILYVGTPLLIQGFFALATWTVFFTWIEQEGTFELTVSQNIRSVYFLAFVPIFGFGATTKTFISQYLGLGKKESIPRIIRRFQFLIVLFLLIFFHGAILYPEKMIELINPKEMYIEKSAEILRLIFWSILIFGLSTPLLQTINGSGNTRFTLYIEIASIIIYLLFAYLFLKVWNWDIYNVWLVEYIYFGSLALFSILYLRLFNWKNKII